MNNMAAAFVTYKALTQFLSQTLQRQHDLSVTELGVIVAMAWKNQFGTVNELVGAITSVSEEPPNDPPQG